MIVPMTEARASFGKLVRQTAAKRERVYISDHGETTVVLISAAELDEIEKSLTDLRQKTTEAAARGLADARARHGEAL